MGSTVVPDDLKERKISFSFRDSNRNRPVRDLLATPTEPQRPAPVSLRVRHPGIIIIIHFCVKNLVQGERDKRCGFAFGRRRSRGPKMYANSLQTYLAGT